MAIFILPDFTSDTHRSVTRDCDPTACRSIRACLAKLIKDSLITHGQAHGSNRHKKKQFLWHVARWGGGGGVTLESYPHTAARVVSRLQATLCGHVRPHRDMAGNALAGSTSIPSTVSINQRTILISVLTAGHIYRAGPSALSGSRATTPPTLSKNTLAPCTVCFGRPTGGAGPSASTSNRGRSGHGGTAPAVVHYVLQ